jgi:SSS family solute:Na+ symporter
MAFIGGGASYMVAGKTMMALTPKPLERCTDEERASVEQFREYQELKERLGLGLDGEERARYEELDDRQKRGELHSFISYTEPIVFYIVYAVLIAAYTMLGGFTAAAITDAIQGVLIVTFSLILIPIGLSRIGGFEGLHASVPDYMFELFGSASTSEYAWYTILAMIVANIVSIVAVPTMMATAGSAKDEMTARFGMIVGMFFKRFIMLFWALAGLLAIGLYAGKLHDPDLIWGHMTYDLLFPGAIGLMLAGIIAANMSSLDALSVTNSALFIRNLYQPLAPGKSERHYINVGRGMIAAVLLGGVGTALFVDNLLDLFKYFISIPAVFGAAVWLGFTWRRLTKWAVIVQVFLCFTVYAIVPNVFQAVDAVRLDEAYLLETEPRQVTIATGALTEDVEAGRAVFVGQTISRPHLIEPTGIFFEHVVRSDPSDPESPRVGEGRFHAEIWILSRLGIDFSRFTKAQLVAVRFAFDALFPFVLLFLLSFATPPVDRKHLDRFFAKMHTPIQPSAEEEERAIAFAAEHPEIIEQKKILPGSSWQILKPGRWDLFGFGGSWLLVGVIVYLLWLLANIGS